MLPLPREWVLAAVASAGLVLGTRRWAPIGRAHLGADSIADRARAGTGDRAQAEAIINRYGRTPLDYFRRWPDKSYCFSSSRQSVVVAYRATRSVAVSLGDPVGPVEEIEPLIGAFVRFCADHGRMASTALFSFKGLRRYKAKFEPAWEERFLVYQDGHAGLVWTALALGRITRAP